MSTWDELLQIAYRLNLLDNITVDTFLVRLVAILAVYARDKSHTDGREVRLRACARLELLLLARNLEKGELNAAGLFAFC